jgi:hypothetical protein
VLTVAWFSHAGLCFNYILDYNYQAELINQLRAIAYAVKSARDTHRQTTLIRGLQGLSHKFVSKFQLPLDPALLVRGIEIKV